MTISKRYEAWKISLGKEGGQEEIKRRIIERIRMKLEKKKKER